MALVNNEAVGKMLVCLGADPPGASAWNLWINVVPTFVLFLLFDILKLPTICPAERLPAIWGFMDDDLLAGLVSLHGHGGRQPGLPLRDYEDV